MTNLLENSGFEADWSEQENHDCLVIPADGDSYTAEIGNIFTPPGWLTWFVHDPDTWDQPEVRDAWRTNDPYRVHGGEKAVLLFTFYRKHDAGFLQQVQVQPGTRLKLAAYAHAWSNSKDGPHKDDARWSEGPGYNAGFAYEGDVQNDDWRNFTFYVGIDPTGGTNPLASTVVWGRGAHIYNAHNQVPPVKAIAQGNTATVFLRSRTLWAFKHNDAYWDDAELQVVEDASSPGRGEPRVQYERTYVLLPPGAGKDWAQAVAEATWHAHRYTIGGSADDAGIGNLDVRRVVAVNPAQWSGDLAGFFTEHYPGVEYISIEAASAADLRTKLED